MGNLPGERNEIPTNLYSRAMFIYIKN